uniref:F-box domain-containing protein n=1 Tax=Panagrellus redivivus TaxID=6233 RepID=A0A7E4VPP2_PANRE
MASAYASSLFAASMKQLSNMSELAGGTPFIRQMGQMATSVTGRSRSPAREEEFESLEMPLVYKDISFLIKNDENGLQVKEGSVYVNLPTAPDAPLKIFEARRITILTYGNTLGNLKQLAFQSVTELDVSKQGDASSLLKTLRECCGASKLTKLTVTTSSSCRQLVSFAEVFKLFPHLEELTLSLGLVFNKIGNDWMSELVNSAPMGRLKKVELISDKQGLMHFKHEDLVDLMAKANIGFRFELKLQAKKVDATYEDLRTNMLAMQGGKWTIDLEEGPEYIHASFLKIEDDQNPADWLDNMVLADQSVRKVFITTSFEFMKMLRKADLFALFKKVKPGAVLELQLHLPGNHTTAIQRIQKRIDAMKDLPFSIQTEVTNFLTVRYRLNQIVSV